MSGQDPVPNPQAYEGVRAVNPANVIKASRDPTANDLKYPLGTIWCNKLTGSNWLLGASGAGVAQWNLVGAGATGAIISITGDAGGAEIPDGGGNFNLLGTANQITTTGTANTITLTIPATFIAPGSIASTTTVTVGTDLIVGGNISLTGNIAVTGTVTVTGLTTLAALTQAGTASINATGAATTTIGSATAGAISMDTTAGVTINADAASSFTTTDAGADLTLQSTLGSVNVIAGQSAADSIVINSLIGGIDIIASGAAAGEDIDITATGSSINLVATEAAVANAIRLNASAADGGIDVDAGTGGITIDSTGAISIDGAAASNFTVTGAGIDLTLSSVGGSVAVSSTENVASAISLTANGGTSETIVVTASQGTGAASIGLTSTAGGITLTAGLATADAINIVTSNAAGGIDIDAGTNGFIVDSTGAFSIDGVAASNVTTTGAGIDLTLSSVLGSVLISSTEDAALAIRLHANGGTSETIQIHADQGTGVASLDFKSDAGGITLTSAKAIHTVSAGLVNIDTATDTQASPSATSVLNVNAGAATFTGFTTAAAGTQDFTITNSLATTSSNILCTICNEGANDAQMTITRVNRGAGSFVVTATNNGAAALNGNVCLTFWILDN